MVPHVHGLGDLPTIVDLQTQDRMGLLHSFEHGIACAVEFMLFLLPEMLSPSSGSMLLTLSSPTATFPPPATRKPSLTLQGQNLLWKPPLPVHPSESHFPPFLFACTAAESPVIGRLGLSSPVPVLRGLSMSVENLWNE